MPPLQLPPPPWARSGPSQSQRLAWEGGDAEEPHPLLESPPSSLLLPPWGEGAAGTPRPPRCRSDLVLTSHGALTSLRPHGQREGVCAHPLAFPRASAEEHA